MVTITALPDEEPQAPTATDSKRAPPPPAEVAPPPPVLDSPQIVTYVTESLSWTAYDVKWLPLTAKFVVSGQNARGAGVSRLYELEKGAARLLHETQHPTAFKCSTFGGSSVGCRRLATGDFAGALAQWDVERMDAPVFSVAAHTEIINAIDGCGGTGMNTGPPELATASRDGTVRVWDVRQPQTAAAVIAPAAGEAKHDAWAVALGNSFNDQERVVAAGYANGDVKLVDLRNMQPLWETNVSNGVCSVEFDRRDVPMNKLSVSALEGQIDVFDLRTRHPKDGFARTTASVADKTTVWLARHLPQNREVVMTSSGNGTLHLWRYQYPAQRVSEDRETKERRGVPGTLVELNHALVGEQPVGSFDWSPDKLGLCAWTGFDQTVRVGIVTRLQGL